MPRGAVHCLCLAPRNTAGFSASSSVLLTLPLLCPRPCREVFNELPLEFAAEVNELMSLKLEGSVG
jgi:hypothetical protein